MSIYLGAFMLGVTLAIAIGPIALLIMRASIERGLSIGARCALGAATADFTFATLALGGGSSIVPFLETHHSMVRAIGASAMVALGVWLAVTALRKQSETPDAH